MKYFDVLLFIETNHFCLYEGSLEKQKLKNIIYYA
jgi:hypothetical protein